MSMNIFDTMITKDAAGNRATVSPGYINSVIAKSHGNDSDRIVRVFDFVTESATSTALLWTENTTLTVVAGKAVLTTAGSNADPSSLTSVTAWATRAKVPYTESVVSLAALAKAAVNFGFYFDANNYAELVYDVAVGTTWRMNFKGGGSAQTIDTGVTMLAATETKLGVMIDKQGLPWFAINDVKYAVPSTVTERISASALKNRVVVTESEAVAKVLTVSYIEYAFNKQ